MGWMMFAAVCAYFIKGLCGFANTLVFSTILSFSTNNVNISPVELVLGLPSNIMISYKERKSVDWKVCLPLAGLVLLGDIPGILMLKNTDTQVIKGIFGFVIIAIGLEMLFREYMGSAKKSQILLSVIGVCPEFYVVCMELELYWLLIWDVSLITAVRLREICVLFS